MDLAPIALFVYNRTDHIKKTFKALKNNRLFDESQLYIYSDGPKSNSAKDKELVEKVREYIHSEKTEQITIIESNENRGLENSLTFGISQILQHKNKIIVLEDDIVTHPTFLQFMNDALHFYEKFDEVWHISGYMFPVRQKLPPTFFFNTASCWGWATWKRAWVNYSADTKAHLESFRSTEEIFSFNIDGSYDYHSHLVQNHLSNMSTWAVKWYASIFHHNALCLHPGWSLTQNIGNDGSGVNSISSKMFEVILDRNAPKVTKIPMMESKEARMAMRRYYTKRSRNVIKEATSLAKSFIPERVKTLLKKKNDGFYGLKYQEYKKIASYPRFLPLRIKWFGKSIYVNDSASFLFNLEEIFGHKVYDFKADTENPYIIDGGANLGLATVRFKHLYPKSSVTVIEADSDIFNLLCKNLNALGYRDVELIHAALWSKNDIVTFSNSGADSGSIGSTGTKTKAITLTTLIDRNVDLLKLDIEGAEVEVLKEVQPKLHYVKNIFIEYHSFTNTSQSLQELLTILTSHNFRYYISSPGLHSTNPFLNINTYMNMDGQLNIYAIRE